MKSQSQAKEDSTTSRTSDVPKSVGVRCKCKVGRCHKCESQCKRCGCDCDGVPPEVALARKPGRGSGKKQTIQETPPECPKHKIARKNYNDENDPGFLAVVDIEKQNKVTAKKMQNKEREFFNKILNSLMNLNIGETFSPINSN